MQREADRFFKLENWFEDNICRYVCRIPYVLANLNFIFPSEIAFQCFDTLIIIIFPGGITIFSKSNSMLVLRIFKSYSIPSQINRTTVQFAWKKHLNDQV